MRDVEVRLVNVLESARLVYVVAENAPRSLVYYMRGCMVSRKLQPPWKVYFDLYFLTIGERRRMPHLVDYQRALLENVNKFLAVYFSGVVKLPSGSRIGDCLVKYNIIVCNFQDTCHVAGSLVVVEI